MPGRTAKPPRLLQRSDGAWVIKDRKRYIRTGCTGSSADALDGAARKLHDYIGSRHQPAIGERNPDRLPIADVLTAYEDAKAPPGNSADRDRVRRHAELIGRLQTLNEFFGDKMVAALKSQICRDYVGWRNGTLRDRAGIPASRRPVSAASARRELEDLRAAVNHYHAEHTLNAVPKITLPPKSSPRDRWLTRGEAARLLGAALGFVWDPATRAWARRPEGGLKRRDRATRVRRAHIARFILLGVYSGRREATIRRTLWIPSVAAPWLDLDGWIYHGRGREERETNKRRPPAAIAFRLRAHLKRWRRRDEALAQRLGRPVPHVIHKTTGAPLRDKIKTGWNGILADAGLGREVVRHILKHTAATWLMQRGVKMWTAAGFLGVTVETLQENYAHHHPDFQDDAASAFGGQR